MRCGNPRPAGLSAEGLKPALRERLLAYLQTHADAGHQLVHKPVVPLKACKVRARAAPGARDGR